MTTTAVIQLHQREAFEENALRALAVGAAAGTLAYFARGVAPSLPWAYFAIAAASLACLRGDRIDRLMLGGLSLLLPALPWAVGLPGSWSVLLGAAAAGVLIVHARVCERGQEGSLGAARPGRPHYALAAVGAGALALAGHQVARVLTARLAQVDVPLALALGIAGAVLALFLVVGTLGAHLGWSSDPVETRATEILSSLDGALRLATERALALYRQTGAILAALPREPAREELARVLSLTTREVAELAAEWTSIEAQLESTGAAQLTAQADALDEDARRAKDPIARAQLQQAARDLRSELGRIDALEGQRERVHAKLKAQVALLERARVALIGMRGGHAQLKSAQLSALARQLQAAAKAQGDEARIADEAAQRVDRDEAPARLDDARAQQERAVKAAGG